MSLGGHLVTVNSPEEDDWIFQTFAPILDDVPPGPKVSLWIGLNDVAMEGEFGWVGGEAVDYTNWSAGEPRGNFPSEDYAGIFVSFGARGEITAT
jgi:hypothetical protein